MDHSAAVNLISKANLALAPSVWADLGSGDGTFTLALADLLAEGSRIYAVDKSLQKLKKHSRVEILFQKADFEKEDFLPASLLPGGEGKIARLDGILMANSLHYIKDKAKLIRSLNERLRPSQWIIVEYERVTSNPWVPFPIDFSRLKELFKSAGFTHTEKTGERESLYGNGKIYSAFIGS